VEPKRISEPALQQLTAFEFPGNVRQLENICHWLTVMAPAQLIESKDLPPEVLQPLAAGVVPATPVTSVASINSISPPATPSSAPVLLPSGEPDDWQTGLLAEALSLLKAGRDDVWDVLTRKFETQLIVAALSQSRGRRIDAAQRLGIGRNTITRKIQELGLE
jgi:two-component system nitrogen regulation response regulator GlnG